MTLTMTMTKTLTKVSDISLSNLILNLSNSECADLYFFDKYSILLFEAKQNDPKHFRVIHSEALYFDLNFWLWSLPRIGTLPSSL